MKAPHRTACRPRSTKPPLRSPPRPTRWQLPPRRNKLRTTLGRKISTPDVHRKFHPRADSAGPSGRLSLHRRLCAGEPDIVLDLDAAWLDRHTTDGVVRAVFPRPGAG